MQNAVLSTYFTPAERHDRPVLFDCCVTAWAAPAGFWYQQCTGKAQVQRVFPQKESSYSN